MTQLLSYLDSDPETRCSSAQTGGAWFLHRLQLLTAKAAAGLCAARRARLLNVHHCLKIKRGEQRIPWKILQGQQMAWRGLVPGQGGLGKDRTRAGSCKHGGIATSGESFWDALQYRNDGEGSQESCIDITFSIIFYYLWKLDLAYCSIAAKFQPIYPISDTLCWVRQTFYLTMCICAGVDSCK